MSNFKLFAAGLTCFFFASSPLAQTKATIQPSANLIVQGIPDIPQSISQDARKYNESRMALFSDWNPVKNEMLIRTRF
jgi:hypothetical protein